MPEKPIIFTVQGHMAQITLDRPQAGNAVNLSMTQELAELCLEINGNDDIYVVVVTGAGNTFCTANELAPAETQLRAAGAIAGVNCPVIAGINGDALGQGLEIALACDVRIAATKARFGFPQISKGEMPFDGGTQRLSRIVGKGKALEMLLGAAIIDTKEALVIGLVTEVADDALAKAQALAQNLAGKGPVALKFLKEAVHKGLDLTLEQGIRFEDDLYFLLHTTADRTEGITAFLQKRPPQFKGK